MTLCMVSLMDSDLKAGSSCFSPSLSFMPSTCMRRTSSPSSNLCFAFGSSSTRASSESISMFLIMTSWRSSPFLSRTSNLSPKSLMTRVNTPTASATITLVLGECLRQKLSIKMISELVHSVKMTTSYMVRVQGASFRDSITVGKGVIGASVHFT